MTGKRSGPETVSAACQTPVFAALAEAAPEARSILEVKDRHHRLPDTVRRLERLGFAR